MRFRLLATDYDGTLAEHGLVGTAAIDALRVCRESGRKLVLVTGRELRELFALCPCLDLFELVVVENGATLYWPATATEKSLSEPPSLEFVQLLRQRGVPVSVGRTIVATVEPYENIVLETIHELGLELQLIFNKGSVMILPTGTNKASGLKAALNELGISRHNVVAIGDGENDHSLLAASEAGIAVASAVPFLKERADYVTNSPASGGVIELIDLLAEDLRALAPRLARSRISLGRTTAGEEVTLPSYGSNILLLGRDDGAAASWKDHLLRQFQKEDLQYCRIGGFVPIDSPDVDRVSFHTDAAATEHLLEHFRNPVRSLVADFSGLDEARRKEATLHVWQRIEELRVRTSRPHWLILDQAGWLLLETDLPQGLMPFPRQNVVLSVHEPPKALARSIFTRFDAVLGERRLQSTWNAWGLPSPPPPPNVTDAGENQLLCWMSKSGSTRTIELPNVA